MNKIIHSLALFMLLGAQMGYCDDLTTTGGTSDTSDTLDDIKTYLYNLGGDMGYDLKTDVASPTNTFIVSSSSGTADGGSAQSLSSTAIHDISTYFGAIPVNSSLLDPTLMNFLPSGSAVYIGLNALVNATFLTYNSVKSTQDNTSTLTVNPLMDQQTYQQDPVNQSILNILGTPGYTYCMDTAGTVWANNNSQTLNDCPLLYQNKVMSNVIGTLPATPYIATGASQDILNELNSNSLTAPLLYSTSSSSSGSTTNTGLVASTQAEQAANFVRYASGMVVPVPLMSQSKYRSLLGQVSDTTTDRVTRENAQATLTAYLANVRIYAAQNSVAMSNLYYILSKRLPQTQTGSQENQPNTTNGSSQALSEMTMATRRMYDPAGVESGKPQWIDQIDTASPSTVQKEMALLLSEINYQLYLNRQQDERLLLTNSLLLIQNLTQHIPDPEGMDNKVDTVTQ